MSQCTRYTLDEGSTKRKRKKKNDRKKGKNDRSTKWSRRMKKRWRKQKKRKKKEKKSRSRNTGQRQDAIHHCRESSSLAGQSLLNREDISSSRFCVPSSRYVFSVSFSLFSSAAEPHASSRIGFARNTVSILRNLINFYLLSTTLFHFQSFRTNFRIRLWFWRTKVRILYAIECNVGFGDSNEI